MSESKTRFTQLDLCVLRRLLHAPSICHKHNWYYWILVVWQWSQQGQMHINRNSVYSILCFHYLEKLGRFLSDFSLTWLEQTALPVMLPRSVRQSSHHLSKNFAARPLLPVRGGATFSLSNYVINGLLKLQANHHQGDPLTFSDNLWGLQKRDLYQSGAADAWVRAADRESGPLIRTPNPALTDRFVFALPSV